MRYETATQDSRRYYEDRQAAVIAARWLGLSEDYVNTVECADGMIRYLVCDEYGRCWLDSGEWEQQGC